MRIRTAAVFLAAAVAAACNDSTGIAPWSDLPDSVTLYSASRADLLGQPSAYDFANLNIVRVEAPGAAGNWDFALTGTTQLQLTPLSAFGVQTSKAAIVSVPTANSLTAVTEAPSDTTLYSYQPYTLTPGNVFVVRTRRVACSFTTAVHYAKVQVVSVDPVAGTARFALVRNPYCNDRSFDTNK